jgi:hypothetical protein
MVLVTMVLVGWLITFGSSIGEELSRWRRPY